MLCVLPCVLAIRIVALVVARIFTKVKCTSLGEVVLVLFGVNILVVCGVFDRFHEASFRRAEGHTGFWETLRSASVAASSAKPYGVESQNVFEGAMQLASHTCMLFL